MRNAKRRGLDAAAAVAVTGEQVLDAGMAWATQVRAGSGLLFRARRQYLVALTDRRLLVFERRAKHRRTALGVADLVLGKRYEFFTLQRRRRYPTLSQLVLHGENDTRLALEFRPSQRALGRALEQHLVSPNPTAASASGTAREGAAREGDVSSPDADERAAAEAFWGSR